MSATDNSHHVVIVGGGFAGLGAAIQLAKHDRVRVTLIDRDNYHQFQPLLYQVATSQIAPSDIAHSLREVFSDEENVDVKLAEIATIDPASKTVTSTDGEQWTGDTLVIAAGSQPNFFGTPGAPEYAFPLYSLDDATKLRSRILGIFEHVDDEPSLVDRGALNFIIVGGGPTGVEVAGSIADMINLMVPAEYRSVDTGAAHIHLLDFGDALLKPFSKEAHGYAAKALSDKGVEVDLGTGVKEVASGHARLSNGSIVATRCVIWGGGIKGATVAERNGLAEGRGGRVEVEADLTLPGNPDVYVIGDVANIPDADGNPLPQLGSVAQQSGTWAADNILAALEGKERKAFAYHDKGIMAMIGRGAAIAEVGKQHHEVHGELAHMAWLGVHASLLTGSRAKFEAVINWSWNSIGKSGGPQVLDRGDAANIDWDDDPVVGPAAPASDGAASTAASSEASPDA